MTLPVAIENINLDNSPAIYKDGGLSPFIEHIKEQVSGEVPDISTDKGRKRIASLAAQVSRSKTAVESPGREYLKHLKALPKEIEKELREFVNACDALRDEVRAPLTEYENKEKERIEKHELAIKALNDIAELQTLSKDECLAKIEQLAVFPTDEACEEFLSRYVAARVKAIDNVNRINKQIELEEELARVRLEEEKRATAEREAKIALDAKLEAERVAAEREAAIKAEAEKAAQEAKEREERLRIEAQNREMQLKLDAENAAKKAEQDRLDAIQKAKADAEAEAARNEQARIANEAAIKAEEEKKAKNTAHRKAINNSILAELLKIGVSDEIGKAIITAAAKGELSEMYIKY